MKTILGLKEKNIKINMSRGYDIKKLHCKINNKEDEYGFVDLIIVKESDNICNLDGYLDQYRFEESYLVPSPFDVLIDLEYGESIEAGDLLYIESICLRENYKNKGYGTKILLEIIDYAKFLNINRIVLSPQPIGFRKEDKLFQQKVLSLEAWYKKYGFNTYLNADDGYKYMVLELENIK